LHRALFEQRLDAVVGLTLLLLGFFLQFAQGIGVPASATYSAALLMMLAGLSASYVTLRRSIVDADIERANEEQRRRAEENA
jgi:Na+/H+ antiporter NhaD/arsenite permease-like protein